MKARDGIATQELNAIQRVVLERIARGSELAVVLDDLCKFIEGIVSDSVCSVMRLDPVTETLHFTSAPCIPEPSQALLNGLKPGDFAGSCGTAYHTGERVLVGNTLEDERWAPHREVARKLGIRGCWSIPIRGTSDEVVGTFAISRTVPGLPSEEQLEILESAESLAGIAIGRDHEQAELRAQRTLLQAVIESTEDPVFAKDTNRRYLLANSAECEGVAPSPEAMIGRLDEDLYTPELAEEMRASDELVLASGRSEVVEVEFDNPQHGRRTFHIRKSPLLDRNGQTYGLVGIARDVTQARRDEEALRQTQKLESLGVLAGGIAHDFNNILTGILGNADLLLDDAGPDSSMREGLEEIRRSARRAAELTDQMLAYSGKGEFVKAVLSLPTVWDDVQRLVASAVSKKARIRVQVEEGLPYVLADPTQLRQLLMNLLTNASEALEDEPGTIRVTMEPFEVEADALEHECLVGDCGRGTYARLRIQDDGCGMDHATLERIFDPFFTTKFAGRGLGLAASMGIIRGHRGCISVHSEPGVGTTFDVYLPATDVALTPQPPAADARGDGRASRGSVLFVDDEEAIRRFARRALERAGYEVTCAVDGREALDRLEDERDGRFDVVVLDLTTPRLGGHDACRGIHARWPDLPVILSSGYNEDDATSELTEGELVGFLKKPYPAPELIEHVEQALRPRRSVPR